MKKTLTVILLIMTTCTLLAQTTGTLTVTTTTSNAGGNYAPRNIVAIWVEDSSGNFVKTLMAYAATRRTHLNNWEASTTAAGSAFNVTDAISGATRTSHATRSCTWNGKDFQQNNMPDGSYTVWMELTDKNSTGNYSSFSFTKGPQAETQTPLDVPSFSSITIQWMPLGVGISQSPEMQGTLLVPDQGNRMLRYTGNDLRSISVYSLTGAKWYEGDRNEIDISFLPDGVYIARLLTPGGIVTQKFLKD